MGASGGLRRRGRGRFGPGTRGLGRTAPCASGPVGRGPGRRDGRRAVRGSRRDVAAAAGADPRSACAGVERREGRRGPRPRLGEGGRSRPGRGRLAVGAGALFSRELPDPGPPPGSPAGESPRRTRPDGGRLAPRPRGARRGSRPSPPAPVRGRTPRRRPAGRRGVRPPLRADPRSRCAWGGGSGPASSSGPEPGPLGVAPRARPPPVRRPVSPRLPASRRGRDGSAGPSPRARGRRASSPSPSRARRRSADRPPRSGRLLRSFLPRGRPPPPSETRPQIRRGDPLNLSILVSGGKETNQDSLSNGE